MRLKDVKNMKNKKERVFAFVSRNLRYGGLALIITAAYIVAVNPSKIAVLLTPFSGNPMILGGVMTVVGVLSTLIGYKIK